jgi:hypothetical protein
VHDLVVLVLRLEVRNLERPDGVERQDQCFISLARSLPTSQVLPDLSQGTENPRPIESLTLTMFAVIHHREAFFRRPSPFEKSAGHHGPLENLVQNSRRHGSACEL